MPQDDGLRCQWNALVQRMESPEVFYTYEWALAVSQAYAASLKPLLLLAYEGEVLTGVAALATGLDQTKASFLAGATADYCDFVSHPEKRSEFVTLVMNELHPICASDLALANLPASSATAHAIQRASSECGCTHFSRPAYQCAQVSFSSPQTRESVKRSVSSKQMIRRQLKTMAQFGPVTFRHLTCWQEISAALPAFRDAHLRRFQALGKTSNLAHPQRWRFLSELARLLSSQGWMTLSILSIAAQPIAWIYGFNFAGCRFYYQPAFDLTFRSYYPGLCLLARFIEDACDRPEIERVDLGLGDEEYKSRFATGYRETVNVRVTRSAVRHVREAVRYHTASAIKSSPRLEHCVRRLLGKPASGGVRA